VQNNNPLKISNKITFLGEIPEINDFEKREIIGKCDMLGKMIDDIVRDDTAIVYKSKKGLFLIVGYVILLNMLKKFVKIIEYME